MNIQNADELYQYFLGFLSEGSQKGLDGLADAIRKHMKGSGFLGMNKPSKEEIMRAIAFDTTVLVASAIHFIAIKKSTGNENYIATTEDAMEKLWEHISQDPYMIRRDQEGNTIQKKKEVSSDLAGLARKKELSYVSENMSELFAGDFEEHIGKGQIDPNMLSEILQSYMRWFTEQTSPQMDMLLS